MERLFSQSSWNVIGASLQGPYHKNKNICNQDSIAWYQNKSGSLPIILAVADGLGDEMFFRSDRGSRFAVEASIETCRKYFRRINRWHSNKLRTCLLKEIISCWMNKIDEDLKNSPFTPEEAQLCKKHVEFILSKNTGYDVRESGKFLQAYAYSTTLNIGIVTPKRIVILQVGDGDIVIVQNDGSTKEIFPRALDCGRVIPLSFPNAIASSSIYRESIKKAKPLSIYISSDGYSAGYDPSITNFDEIVAFEFHEKFQEYEINEIQEALPYLLEELSRGSGDDISLGIITGSQKKIRRTPLKLKNTTVDAQGIKNPGTCEEIIESTQSDPDKNFNDIGEKNYPPDINAGLGGL